MASPKGRDAQNDAERSALARRKLLKAALYVAPAIVSTVVVREAAAQKPSCGPSATPCTPNICKPNKK
jgi:hypothetical protein